MRERLAQFKNYLDQIEDDFDRVHAIMDLGRKQITFGSQPTHAVQVPGCQSTLWVWAEKTVCGHCISTLPATDFLLLAWHNWLLTQSTVIPQKN